MTLINSGNPTFSTIWGWHIFYPHTESKWKSSMSNILATHLKRLLVMSRHPCNFWFARHFFHFWQHFIIKLKANVAESAARREMSRRRVYFLHINQRKIPLSLLCLCIFPHKKSDTWPIVYSRRQIHGYSSCVAPKRVWMPFIVFLNPTLMEEGFTSKKKGETLSLFICSLTERSTSY